MEEKLPAPEDIETTSIRMGAIEPHHGSMLKAHIKENIQTKQQKPLIALLVESIKIGLQNRYERN
ncbi:MAG: hypothetical protein ACXIUL_03685 [Wenzhouxiangella sp.]